MFVIGPDGKPALVSYRVRGTTYIVGRLFKELAKLLPNCEFIQEWKTGAALASAKVRVKEFLRKHTPAGASQ